MLHIFATNVPVLGIGWQWAASTTVAGLWAACAGAIGRRGIGIGGAEIGIIIGLDVGVGSGASLALGLRTDVVIGAGVETGVGIGVGVGVGTCNGTGIRIDAYIGFGSKGGVGDRIGARAHVVIGDVAGDGS